MRIAVAAAVVLLALPASALAVTPTLTVRDVPLHAARSLASATPRFTMLGLHWRGAGTVDYRVRSLSGRWLPWRRADSDGEVERGWRLGGLDWTGAATAARFRTHGAISRLRAYYVDSPAAGIPQRRLQAAGSPPIISRFSWQADESIRRAAPVYADGIHFAVVHHTAGANDYTRAQSAAIVRGIEIYHVKGNGWNDIGYNFLVDRYGQVFEGRYGGIDKPVIGAHAQGFNDGSVGVAVIGSYGSTRISAAAKAALEQLLAWKLDLAHVDPLSTLTWRSQGNPRFPRGVPVFLRAISGHRDTGFTDCPGDALYGALPQVARDVAKLGGPKIYAPLARSLGEGQVRFTARLSVVQPWTVTITSSSGTQVAQGAGTGSTVDWTWDGSAAPPDKYTWTIAASTARTASGTLGATVALALRQATATPAAVAPGETTNVSYRLTVPAVVTATLLSPTGAPLSTLLTAAQPAGQQSLAVAPSAGLPNGSYAVLLSAVSGTRTVTATVPLVVDDVLTGFAATGPSLAFTFTSPPVAASFQVLRGGAVVATPAAPALAAGPQTLTWDLQTTAGGVAPDGTYTLALTVTDDAGTFALTAPFVLDTTPPKIQVLSYRNLVFRIGEAATLTLTVGSRTYTRALPKPTTTQFRLRSRPASYVLTAVDAAGNRTVVRYPPG